MAALVYLQADGWYVSVAGLIVGFGPTVRVDSTLALVDSGELVTDPLTTEYADLSAPAEATTLQQNLHGKATDSCGWEFAGGHAHLNAIAPGPGETVWDAVQSLDGLQADLDVTVSDLASADPGCCKAATSRVRVTLAVTEDSFP